MILRSGASTFCAALILLSGCSLVSRIRGDDGETASASSSDGSGTTDSGSDEESTQTAAAAANDTAGAEQEPAALPPLPHDDFSGPLHEQLGGRIVFSAEPVPKAPTSTDAFVDTLPVNSPIHARVFLADSMANAVRARGYDCQREHRRLLRVTVGEDAVYLEANRMHENDFQEWMVYAPENAPERSLTEGPLTAPEDRNLVRYQFVAGVLPRLQEGDNTVRFEAIAECYGRGERGYDMIRETVAQGELTLQVGPGQLRRTIAGARLRLQSPNHRENRALQGSIRETVEAAWRNEEFVDASVVSEDWNVRTNRITNRPIERTVQAMVVVKGRESGLCRVYAQSFTQQARTDRAGWVPGLTMGTGTDSPFPCPGR